jgi:hypothetical protein
MRGSGRIFPRWRRSCERSRRRNPGLSEQSWREHWDPSRKCPSCHFLRQNRSVHGECGQKGEGSHDSTPQSESGDRKNTVVVFLLAWRPGRIELRNGIRSVVPFRLRKFEPIVFSKLAASKGFGDVAAAVGESRDPWVGYWGPRPRSRDGSWTKDMDRNSPRLDIACDRNAAHPPPHRHASTLLRRTSFADFGHACCAWDAQRSEHHTLRRR